jgi:hypothetical protein
MSKGTKWLVTLVMVLVLANIGLAASIWLKKEEAKPQKGTQPKGDAREVLISSLSLSQMQVHTFDSLRKEHFDRVRLYREGMRALKDQFFAQLSEPRNAHTDTLAKMIGEVQAKIDLETFDHFSKLRSLLNKEQQQKFDETIQDVLRTMAPKGPGPQGLPGRRMGPPPHDGPPPPDGSPH